jgi:hypothetical protein
MTLVRLNEFQVRLLLCSPKVYTEGRMLWECGCVAFSHTGRKYDIATCAYHAPLLCEVHELDDATYEQFTRPEMLYRSALPSS